MKVKLYRGENEFSTIQGARKTIIDYLKSHKGAMVDVKYNKPVDNYSGDFERKSKTFYKSDFEDYERFEWVIRFVIETNADECEIWSVERKAKKLEKFNKKIEALIARTDKLLSRINLNNMQGESPAYKTKE